MTPAITPTTPALQEPIRTELPVQYIQQLPNIENLLLHLEGKGRKPATLQATEKGLKALALRADLRDIKVVELATARCIKGEWTICDKQRARYLFHDDRKT